MHDDARWMDILSLVFSVIVVGLAAAWLAQSGALTHLSLNQANLVWYMIRAAGITAYILLTISVLWGLALSSSAVKDWSPGPLSMVLHATISWLALLFALGHGVLLLFDDYFTYTLKDILVPFTGPYRPVATGLGVMAFWGLLLVTPSFALKKRLFSHKSWQRLHRTTYVTFLFATAHGLLTGTDASKAGLRALFALSVLVSVIMLGYRIGVKKGARKKPRHARPRAATRTVSAPESSSAP